MASRGRPYRTYNNNIHGSPPPPYIPPTPTNAPSPPSPPRTFDEHVLDEGAPLLSKEREKHHKYKLIHYSILLLFLLMVIGFWSVGPMVSAGVRHEIAEWERVREEELRDIARLREEKRDLSDDLEILRIQRDEQRREWELEKEENEKRRHGHLPFWGEARLRTAHCPSDRFRRYEARMYNLLVEDDWYAACMKESIKIAGRTLTSPRSCINHGLDKGVHGYWSFEVNTRECPRTIWDRLRNIFK